MADNLSMKKKILLIDDDKTHLDTTEIVLKNEFDIYKAMSGEEALQYLCSNNLSPDLILLDIIMPDMDGWEVFRRIKAIGLLKNVPILFLTSIDGDNEKAREIGAADYIVKPFNVTFLKTTINRILEVRKREEILEGLVEDIH